VHIKLVYIIEQVNLGPKFFNSAVGHGVSLNRELNELLEREQAYLSIREEFQSDFERAVQQSRHNVNGTGVLKGK
jgi:hypothetical protein